MTMTPPDPKQLKYDLNTQQSDGMSFKWHDKPSVLVVDDTPENLALIADLLKGDYRVKVCNSGEKALKIADTLAPPDIILLDIMMPNMDGYEVCQALKARPNTANIPIIFLTAMSESEDETKGLELGAVDYLIKPVNPTILRARVRNHLILKSHSDFLKDKTVFLEEEVQRRAKEVTMVQDVTIMTLASLAETRDSDTGNHIIRTQFYVKALAEKLRQTDKYRNKLSREYIDILYKSAPLHDIGKVGIPDRILLKPGRFESGEFDIMKSHPLLGKKAIEHAEKQLGISADFLNIAKEIAYCHHEKWDGSGYPEGLKGEEIPLSARLMAIADVYDALICKRIYKDAMPQQEAIDIIMKGRGTHFDPFIVDNFMEILDTMQLIAEKYADTHEDLEEKEAHLSTFRK